MKDWKFLQVGNTKTKNETIDPSDAELRKLEDELNGWLKMYDSRDPNVDKGNIEKNIRAIRADIEKYKRKHKIVDNESIDKQEWSMFNGLKKDAEKEIGNEFATPPKEISIGDNVETLTGKKGNVVEKNGHILKIKLSDGSFEYEHEYKAKKVGNRSIRTEKKGDWVVVYINSWKAGAGKAEYKGETLGWQTDGHTYGMTPSGMKNATAFRKTYRTEPTDKQIEKDLIEDFWIHHNDKETMEKIGNKKVGNAFDAGIHLTIRYNGKEEEVKVLKDMPTSVVVKGQNGAVVEIKKVDLDVLKVHNAKPGSIASIGPAWMHGGTVYGKMDTDESGKHHNEYVKITWLGEGKGGVANYFIDDRMQSDKLGSLDKNELKRWAESKIGNSTWSEPRKMPFQQKSLKYAYEKAKGNGLSGKRLEEEMLRIAKTLPHESSATEEEKKKDVSEWILRNGSKEDFVNNLARARNAMKKKVTNSAVREYKDREGRIAQIDFNEDGTDADMSIYEDERMTRSVDHKNFSTIRDAEQYVQSHGFRRVG